MRSMFGIDKPDRQSLVNYLVHLEGVATLVNTGVLRLKTINDLMAYRYFIAVNNPVVQELELNNYQMPECMRAKDISHWSFRMMTIRKEPI